jgi:hypothetical protein
MGITGRAKSGTAENHPAATFRIRPPAQLIQEPIADGCHGVTRYPPTGDKTMRLHAQTGEIILFCAGEPDRSEVRPTLRWRGMDSNLQFRDAAAPPTARPWCDAARSGR